MTIPPAKLDALAREKPPTDPATAVSSAQAAKETVQVLEAFRRDFPALQASRLARAGNGSLVVLVDAPAGQDVPASWRSLQVYRRDPRATVPD